jgi:hypothetical protein
MEVTEEFLGTRAVELESKRCDGALRGFTLLFTKHRRQPFDCA